MTEAQKGAELEAQVALLKRELHDLRFDLIQLAPPEVESILRQFGKRRTRAELGEWEDDAVDVAVRVAIVRDDGWEQRANCPLCGDSSRNTFVKGFKFPVGLEWHLRGRRGARHCIVMKTAIDLARASILRAASDK